MLAKEKMANEQREESEAELKEHMEKFEDIKRKLEQKEDDLNAKNINFEKE